MAGSRRKILFVEDNLSFRRLITKQLQTRGYHVIVAGDIEEATESLENNEIDAILLDIKIQGESGYSFLKSMKEDFDKSPPVIIVSAISEKKFLDSAEEKMEYEHYIEKPTDIDEIENVLT